MTDERDPAIPEGEIVNDTANKSESEDETENENSGGSTYSPSDLENDRQGHLTYVQKSGSRASKRTTKRLAAVKLRKVRKTHRGPPSQESPSGKCKRWNVTLQDFFYPVPDLAVCLPACF